MPSAATDIRDAAILRAGGLAVMFERRGDRIAHRIVIVDQAGERLLLESVEGTPDDPWPPSPALQEGRIESAAGRGVAMLVGMAGKSHWSVSIEADAERESLTFDVACRIKQSAEWLGSIYSSEERGLALIDCDKSCTLKNEPNRLLIAPPTERIALPATIRWRYEVAKNNASIDNR